jgi:hypothetical protein
MTVNELFTAKLKFIGRIDQEVGAGFFDFSIGCFGIQ